MYIYIYICFFLRDLLSQYEISGGLVIRSFCIGGRLVSCARHSVQHGSRYRYRPQRRRIEENVLTPEHRRR